MTIVIVGVGLVGMTAFFNMNIQSQFEVKNEVIAANLAQEGIELVRNIRDYNVLKDNPWDQGLTGCIAIDFNSLTTHACSVAGSAVCLSGASRYYQCAAPGNTDFTRTITVDALNADGSRNVTCRVTWNGRTAETKLVLYNNQF
ncbi:MAG: hypothetical protein A3J76_05425 [Candidatus Moranbacteria bacterium RBG_13_45_13]|nr:MAG: hypothetical protein A3J76_05425 [Candidatus Moranbacteria bacterium RBG_13_45_13]